MKDWTDGCADVTITDPPYSDKTHKGARTGDRGENKLIHFDSVDSQYIINLAKRLCVISKRWVVMTCDWIHCAEIAKACPDIFIRAGVWTKPNPMPQMSGDRPAMGWEAVAILHRPGVKKWNGGGHAAVWNFNKISGEHPTQKPMDLIIKWMHWFSNEGETILDPYCGSGTTLLAAEKMNRKWIGIELDPKYVQVAQSRIDAEKAQGRLF
jgi:site-specific DNA-methyltransferase (adenine-specific)